MTFLRQVRAYYAGVVWSAAAVADGTRFAAIHLVWWGHGSRVGLLTCEFPKTPRTLGATFSR